MKPLLIAAALLLLPVAVPTAALAQVAAGSLPNSFDGPAPAPRALVPAPSLPVAPAATAPVNARSEEVLREIIAGAQSGSMNYGLMTDDLGNQVRQQEATLQPLIQGFGAVIAVDFVGVQDGVDLFAVTFANAATEWVVGFNEADKVAALLFRPAE